MDGHARILVVDDDDATRRLFAETLRRAGCVPLGAASGDEALAMLAREPVDLVLLDRRMPGRSGLDTLAAIRESSATRTLPVILVTGEADAADHVTGLETGADDYLTKPVELPVLVARVRAHLRARGEWTRVVGGLRERTELVVELLRDVPADTSVDDVARALVARLDPLPWVRGSAVLVFDGPSGRAAAAGGVLGGVLARDQAAAVPAIRARLLHGPFLVEDRLRGNTPEPAETLRDVPPPVAVAPMRVDRLVGALLVAARPAPGAPGDWADQALSATIDLAGAASTLVSRALARDLSDERARATLRAVLDAGAFTPHFQPAVDLASGRVVGYEALTRWHDGTRPDVRFAEAHALGAGLEAERVTLAAAVEHAHALPPDAWLSLDASASLVVLDPELPSLLAGAARGVVLELTEHERVDDYDALRAALGRLGPGVRVAVDDAGAGYASLRHILRLAPAIVKLDGDWIRGLDGDPARAALVAGLRHFADAVGCALLAEGVETTGEHDTLRELGVHLAQGYLFGRPAPAGATA